MWNEMGLVEHGDHSLVQFSPTTMTGIISPEGLNDFNDPAKILSKGAKDKISKAMNDSTGKMLKSEQNKICNLPDAVLHHILSFLDMKEVVATSLLSTRWRYLWVSLPVLNFNDYYWETKLKDGTYRSKRFINFVDRVLLLRDGSNISKLRISFSSSDSERIDAWLTVATRRQFEEVHLDLIINEPEEMPRLLFYSLITVLVLDARDNLDSQIKIPSFVCFSPLLKTLYLHNFELPEGNSDGELVFSNSVLENLTLKDCNQAHLKVLNISTYRLKNLVIQILLCENVGSCQIKLCTPNLVSIDLISLWYEGCCLGDLSSLVSAKFEADYWTTQYLVELLEGVSCPTTIGVSGCWEDHEELPDMLTRPYANIRCLEFYEWGCNRGNNRCLLNLLSISPYLETLSLHKYGMDDLEEPCLHPITFDHLKYVDIHELKVGENKLRFLKFLMKNAIILEKLTIDAAWGDLKAKQDFGDKINSLTRASPKLTVLLI